MTRRLALLTSLVLWVFMALLALLCAIKGGEALWNKAVTGLGLQFIGTVYWADRVRDRPSWIGGFWIRAESPDWERMFFGAVAGASLIAGAVITLLAIWSRLAHSGP